jgi:hypothetical protein
MDHSLYQQFSTYFPHFSRGIVKNFLLLAQALLASRSTNLNTVKDRIGTLLGKPDRQPATHYKRLIRFFRCPQATLLTECIQRFTFRLLSGRVKYLILDSTCWQIGQKWVHLQVLCIVYQQVAIPIFWRDLAHDGHSNGLERQELMRDAARIFDLKGKILLADREYVGDDWLRFLADLGVDFVVRLPIKCYKKQVKNYSSLQQKARRRKRAVSTPIEWEGYRFQLVMKKNPAACPDEPILYWITSLPDAITASELYRKRWKIEICFKCCKTNGFNLQQMNFKSPAKIALLMAIVVFAYVLCLLEGMEQRTQITTKRYRSGASGPAQSFFKRGLQEVNARLLDFGRFLERVKAWFDNRLKVKWGFVQ